MATLNYANTKVNKLYYQNTEVKKCYYQNVLAYEAGFPKPSSHTPGDTITWDNKSWLVCHYDSANNQVYLIASDTVDNTIFGSNNAYAGSTLATRCTTYQRNNMSASALTRCVDVTVNGVTAKVFVPSQIQMLGESYGGFSWFSNNSRRKVAGNTGAYTHYWTSTGYTSEYVYHVESDGSVVYSISDLSFYRGFRPCVCVQL